MSEQESRYTQTDGSLDELAKGLAGGTLSRRRALRLMGAALFGGAVASIPGVAWAKGPCKGPGLKRCRGRCIDTLTDVANCGACGNKCRPEQICSQGVCICPFDSGTCGISVDYPYGTECCTQDQVCCQDVTAPGGYRCAPEGSTQCPNGSRCCPQGTGCCPDASDPTGYKCVDGGNERFECDTCIFGCFAPLTCCCARGTDGGLDCTCCGQGYTCVSVAPGNALCVAPA